ncbi:hypothetical protein ACRS8P_36270 [Burkholderia cenocepacia]
MVRQAGDERIDTGALASLLKASIAQDLIAANDATRSEIDAKDQTIARLQRELDAHATQQAELARVARELRTQYPQIREILYGATDAWDAGASAPAAQPFVTFVVSSAKPLPRADRQRIERWLGVRLDSPRVRVVTSG